MNRDRVRQDGMEVGNVLITWRLRFTRVAVESDIPKENIYLLYFQRQLLESKRRCGIDMGCSVLGHDGRMAQWSAQGLFLPSLVMHAWQRDTGEIKDVGINQCSKNRDNQLFFLLHWLGVVLCLLGGRFRRTTLIVALTDTFLAWRGIRFSANAVQYVGKELHSTPCCC